MTKPPRMAALVLAVVVLFPLLPWLGAGPVGPRFAGDAVFKSVANLAAFFAIAAWSANLVLASRLRPIERACGGLEHLYRIHRHVGVAVFVLAVTHVVFLMVHAGSGALELWLPAAGWATFAGVIALAGLASLVTACLLARMSYPVFVRAQRLLGAAFVLGAAHAIAIRGTAASSTVLTIYLACLTAAGIASLAYRLLGGRLGAGRRRFRVDEVRHLGDDVVEVTLAPAGRPMEFRAGQFVYATFEQDGIPREAHPFTIASAPGAGTLRIAVKRLGDFTAAVMSLRAGSHALLEGPFGTFDLQADGAHPQTWIAGGIGVTPFLSWARSLEGPVKADLYYCMPGPERAHFIEELYEVADRYPAFRVVPMRARSLGHLSADDIAGVNPNLLRGHVFICGPPILVENLTTELVARGVPQQRIHSEAFDFR